MTTETTEQTNRHPLRPPTRSDYLIFYLGLPLGFAILFGSFGIRLTVGMPFIDSLAYMFIHLLAAWWGIDLGTRCVRWLFRSWRPPVSVNIVIGFFLMLVPMTFFYQSLGETVARFYPTFAEARQEEEVAAWSIGYLLHYLRYSIPSLPMFMLGVFAYRYVQGVDWYSYDDRGAEIAEQVIKDSVAANGAGQAPATGLFGDTSLPVDAILVAIKAEEHYIRIWSDSGTDLLRYRFQDAVSQLQGYEGMQVHRSWWANLNCVKTFVQKGRSLELVLDNDIKVPVSLAYKQAVMNRLDTD